MKRILTATYIVFSLIGVTQAGRRSSGYSYGTGSNLSTSSNKGYIKKSGNYVQPHFKSKPNKTELDNWSTRGNSNPWTGKEGTKTPKEMK